VSDNWFFRTLGSEFGPIGSAELGEMIQSGELTPADEIRKENSDEWLTVEQTDEFPIQTSDPEPQPQTAQTAQSSLEEPDEFDDILSAAADLDETPSIDAFLIKNEEKQSSSKSIGQPDDLLKEAAEIEEFSSIEEIDLQSEDEYSRQAASLELFLHEHGTQPSPASDTKGVSKLADDDFVLAETVPAGEMADWYAKVQDVIMGPFSHLELQMKISQRLVGPADLMKQGKANPWRKARKFSDFDFPQAPVPVQQNAEQQPVAVAEPEPSPANEPTTAAAASITEPDQPQAEPEPAQSEADAVSSPPEKTKTESTVKPTVPVTPPLPSSSKPENNFNKNKIVSQPPRSRSKKVSSLDLSFDFGFLSGETLKNLGIALAIAGFLYVGFMFLWGDPGDKYYHQMTALWYKIDAAHKQDPQNFSQASAPFLAEAEALVEKMKPIPNNSSRLFAVVKSMGKDGILPFLKKTQTPERKKTVEIYLQQAKHAYENK